MANNGRNTRMNRCQMDNRREKPLIKGIMLLAGVVILAVVLLCIRDLYGRLEEIHAQLETLRIQSDGMIQTSTGTLPPKEAEEVQGAEEADYIGTLDTWEVSKPIERTEAEVLIRLGELGQTSPMINEINQKHSMYPKELLAALANNPEMADFVSGYPESDGVTGGITASEKEQEFPLFLQWDPRWGYVPYGDSCIGLAGCGPTCLSMVLFCLTRDETLTPNRICAYSMENGYYVEGTGTSWALMEDMPKLYGIKAASLSLSAGNMRAVLDNGDIIICAMGKGDFTLSGHYIVIYGYDNEGFMVNDPNCVARSSRRWTFSDIQYQIRNIWVYSKESK